jgi:hypothetical protein
MDKLLCVCGRTGVVLLVGAQCVVFREQASGAGPHTRYVSWLRARHLGLRIAGVAVREPARRSGPPVLAWNLQALTFPSRVITIPETVVRSTIQYECGKITDAIPAISFKRYEPGPIQKSLRWIVRSFHLTIAATVTRRPPPERPERR